VKQSDQLVLFLHIPKAGGTTIQQLICRHYPPKSIFALDPAKQDVGISDLRKMSPDVIARLNVIMGHMGYGIHQFLERNVAYVTMLRNPVDRIVSNYYYVLRTPSHCLHKLLKRKRMGLAEYAASGLTPQLENGQTRILASQDGNIGSSDGISCNTKDLDRARDILKNRIEIVGVMERFDESLLLMQRRFGWNCIKHVPANIGPKNQRRPELDEKTLDIIRSRNELDQILYKDAVEIMDNAVRKAGDDFNADVEKFRAINTQYGRFALNNADVCIAEKGSIVKTIRSSIGKTLPAFIKQKVKSIAGRLGVESFRKVDSNPVLVESWGPYSAQLKLLNNMGLQTPLVFDVGAHRGGTAAKYRSLFPESEIYCFEPCPSSFHVLENGLALDKNVRPIPVAIADRPGIREFNANRLEVTNSLLPRPSSGRRYYPKKDELLEKIEVEVACLDDFCIENPFQVPDILKIDIQGGEMMAFEGARKILESGQLKLILLEAMFVPHYEGGALLRDIWNVLAKYGYSIFNFYDSVTASNGQLRFCDALFVSDEVRRNVNDAEDREP
jgi:FkbM family methyltransferase